MRKDVDEWMKTCLSMSENKERKGRKEGSA